MDSERWKGYSWQDKADSPRPNVKLESGERNINYLADIETRTFTMLDSFELAISNEITDGKNTSEDKAMSQMFKFWNWLDRACCMNMEVL